MVPQGYISVQEAAEQLSLPAPDFLKLVDAAGVAKFQSRGTIVIRAADFEKLRPAPKPKPPAQPEPGETEDIDIDKLLSTAPKGDSSFLESVGLSGSGLFDMAEIAKESGPSPRSGTAWVTDSAAASVAQGSISMDLASLMEEQAPEAAGIAVDTASHLMIDDTLIESLKNAKRVFNRPTKFAGNPILLPDTPWEDDGICTFGGSVLWDPDEKLYKMWYYAVTRVGRTACLAVSADGMKWTKPEGDAVTLEGRRTNIVMSHPTVEGFADLLGVVRDPYAPAPGRYKAVFVHQNPQQASQRSLRAAASPDGMRWTASGTPILDAGDIGSFHRDEISGKYVIHTRSPAGAGRRAIVRVESSNFLHWSKPETALEAAADDPETDEIYSLSAFGAGASRVGLLQVLHGAPHYTVDLQLAVSADGKKWSRPAKRDVYLPVGTVGDWDRFQVAAASAPVPVGERDLHFYYGCRSYRHAPYLGADKGPSWGAIGVARLRRDGYAHLESNFEGGVVVTKPVVLRHPDLRVNADSAFGGLQVSLLDDKSEPIPDMTAKAIASDGVDLPVVFPGAGLKNHTNKPVRLRITLKNAKLYSLRTRMP